MNEGPSAKNIVATTVAVVAGAAAIIGAIVWLCDRPLHYRYFTL